MLILLVPNESTLAKIWQNFEDDYKRIRFDGELVIRIPIAIADHS